MKNKKYKYPRTYHLPWSLGITNGDKVIKDTTVFNNKCIIVTEKMGGENTTMYCDYIHARSLNSNNHPSRDYVKNLWAKIRYQIPEGWRLCGENVFAKHSIHYKNLDSYFYVFSVWDEHNRCLNWSDMELFCSALGLKTVKVLFEGLWDDIRHKIRDYEIEPNTEGYVIRSKGSFHYDNFNNNIAKFVRDNHVQTNKHWMKQPIIKNKLKRDQ